MIPPIEKFREAMEKAGGNVTLVAKAFEVQRHTVYDWMAKDPEYKKILDDSRGSFLDEALTSARILVSGIPDIQDVSEGGKIVKRQVGWITPPDSGMTRYILGTLGRNDGFGERLEIDTTVSTKDYQPRDPQDAKDYFDWSFPPLCSCTKQVDFEFS
jgi:hypothetical protein